MEVFSKSYLEEVVENQGKLFEYVEEHYPGIDVADFIESYMKSYTRLMSVQWMQKRYTIISWKMINMNQSREKRQEDLLQTGLDNFMHYFNGYTD